MSTTGAGLGPTQRETTVTGSAHCPTEELCAQIKKIDRPVLLCGGHIFSDAAIPIMLVFFIIYLFYIIHGKRGCLNF